MIAVLAAALAVTLVATGLLVVMRARRLHRLHVRVDAARAGLDVALHRRALLAARAGVPSRGPVRPPGTAHTAVWPHTGSTVCAATRGCVPSGGSAGEGPAGALGREAAANALGVALAALDRASLDPGLRADLAEAEDLLVLARHVHNEAVRDTLALRSRRLVRLLSLAGTAPMPQYFETVDPPGVTRAAAAGPGA